MVPAPEEHFSWWRISAASFIIILYFVFQRTQAMEGLQHYINPAHAISLLSALNEERLKGQLCDVLLIVGDQKFRAHKNVLAASSEYLSLIHI